MEKSYGNPKILEKVENLINKAKLAEHSNVEEALTLCFDALELASKNNLIHQKAKCQVQLGRCYWISGEFDQALNHFEEAMELCNHFQGEHTRVESMIGIGNVYSGLEMFDIALTNYNQALQISKLHGFDILTSTALNNLGGIHEELKNYHEALKYYKLSLDESLEIDDHYGVCIANLNIGTINFKLDELSEARSFLSSAIEYAEKNEKTLLLAHAYFTLGSMSKKLKEYDQSIMMLQLAEKKALASKDLKVLFRIYLMLSKAYCEADMHDEAEATLMQCLDVSVKLGVVDLEVIVYERIAEFYDHIHEPQKSMAYYKKYRSANKELQKRKFIERRKTIDYLSKLSDSQEETKVFQTLSNELERSFQNMKVISDIGRTLTSKHQISQIFAQLYDSVNSLMNAESLSVCLFNKETNQLDFDLVIERGQYLDKYSLDLDNEKSLIVWSFLNNQSIKLNNVRQEYSKYTKGFASTKGELMLSVMIAPLVVEEEVIGAFSIQAMNENSYTESHKVLLETLASYLAISIRNATKTRELAKLNKVLKDKSEKDGLTGIPNRRLFDERYQELWEESIDQNKISVAIMDIDNFKFFNDEYGHLVGDEVVKIVAKTLDEQVGDKGFVARYGGDEFVAVLLGMNDQDLKDFDFELRNSLKLIKYNIDIDKDVTLSVGIASCIPTKLFDRSKLVYYADNQLYESKANGKNTLSIKYIK